MQLIRELPASATTILSPPTPTAPHPTIAVFAQGEDWSFAHLTRAETLWGPHGYHRYPAKFIPQLTRKLIELYSQPGDFVADQFLGSGTTGVEALRAGRRFFGSDISSVAVLISLAKCLPILPSELEGIWQHLNSHLNAVARVTKRRLTDTERAAISAIDIAQASPTSTERFHYWFPKAHRNALEQILHAVKAIENTAVRTFFLCAFSNILRGCSIWLSGSTKAQKDLNKTLADPADAFRRQVGDMLRRNKLYWQELMDAQLHSVSAATEHTIAVADARYLPLADASVDLLLTSPPYSTCYEYAALHQLTRLWFERYDLISLEADSQQAYIGSKGVSGRAGGATLTPGMTTTTENPNGIRSTTPFQVPSTGSAKADTAIAALAAKGIGPAGKNRLVSREARALRYYFEDMKRVIEEAARVVAPGKYMVLVIGDTKKRGITIPTSDALTELARAAGFVLERKIVREIPVRILTTTRDQTSGRFSSTASSDARAYPEEDILVFHKVNTLMENSHRDG
jgi:DNA modification methylase